MSTNDHDQTRTEQTHDNGDQMRQGAKQLVDGASKVAAGAKDYLDAHMAPAVKNAARTSRERIGAKTREAGGPLALARRYAPKAIPMAALVAIMGLYLPIASFHGYGLSYMDAGSNGKILLVLAILTIIAAVLNLVVKPGNTWLRLAAGIGAGCVGLGALLDGFGNLFAIGASFGSFFLGLAGFALVAAGVLTLFNKPRQL
jgi:X-X-X-Leu-X-X-Gly heptad repeat protein